MSEVKRFYAGELSSHEYVIKANDFDRVTAERDAAIKGRQEVLKQLVTTMFRLNELQDQANAADERADVLETALAGMLFAFDDGVGLEWSEDLLDFARKLTSAKEFKAALKPAEVERQPLELEGGHFEGHFPPGAYMALPLGSTFTIIPADNGTKICDCNQGRLACNGRCKP